MFSIGQTISHYSVVSKLGKGGMGEVYGAKDQKLGRDVAIKVLPDEFANDQDRVARFQREAKLLASLNHPNIASIYGLEESGGTHFLVLEFVEGGTLADEIKEGPVPVEEALKLALQIAEALEAAHEKGVIHRDLKPANIKVTPDGKVKVLDFGLAKAYAGDREEINLTNSPTLSDVATQQGVILGTAAYMSPEQARGKSVDKRTDVWAFGCVLFEMLTGKGAFQGEDVTEILASVVKGGADLDLLPANVHPRVREVLTRCLQKDLKRRYSGINDARYEIEQALADPQGVLVQPGTSEAPRRSLIRILPWVTAAVVLTAILAGVAGWILKPQAPRFVTWMSQEIPKDQQFSSLYDSSIAVSPDGRQVVYCTTAGLCLRSLDELNAKLIPGTGGRAGTPFFSPDGKWIGYQEDGQLKKIPVSGGAPVTLLANAGGIGSFFWGEDGNILFGRLGTGIVRVSASGGTPETIVKAERGFLVHPQVLPGGESVLFTVAPAPFEICVQSLKSGERQELFEGDTARFLPTGDIIYHLGNNLMAVAFDLKALKPVGGSVTVIEGVFQTNGAPQFAVSDSGTLAYLPGSSGDLEVQRTLVWVDQSGKEEALVAEPKDYGNLRISPDGTRVALSILEAGNRDIWVRELALNRMTRLTFDTEIESAPLWTPDGKRIAFYRGSSPYSIYWKAADGTGKEELLRSMTDDLIYPMSWSGDGKTLIDTEISVSDLGLQNFDIGALSIEGEREWRPLLKEKYSESQPRVSPDGRWIAYTSNETEKNEVYVRPFPQVDQGRWQVSEAGGDSPLWSPDGRELYYLSGEAVMVVAVKTDSGFRLGAPTTLFSGTYVHDWDLHPDGKRFLMMKEAGSVTAAEGPRSINIALNWFEELKQRLPGD